MSINWIDLSRYGIQVALGDINGESKPIITGDQERIAECSPTLKQLGFTLKGDGSWNLEWSAWPSIEAWEEAFPMHKKRPLADFAEQIILDESSAIGLIGRNALTQAEYEAAQARKAQASVESSQQQPVASENPASTPPSANERIVNWPDFSAYGLDARFVKVSQDEKAFVHIQGAEAVKRLYQKDMEMLGVEVTEIDGKLDFRIPPGEKLPVAKIQETLPNVKKDPVPLSARYLTQVPEAPAMFDATALFDGQALRAQLSKAISGGREERFSLDDIKRMASEVTGLDARLIRHEFGLGDRRLLEEAETAMTDYFRQNLKPSMSFSERIDLGAQLDNLMPRSGSKTANSSALQQFSTPLAISAALQSALYIDQAKRIWEPTIGNGSLVSLANNADNIHGLEIDEERLKRIHEQGYQNVKHGDAIHSVVEGSVMDRVVINPPFGSFPDKMGARQFQTDVPNPKGPLPSIDLAAQDKYIALRHLEQLEREGFGGIILGADHPARHAAGEYSEETERYLNFVADNYNVVDISYVEGKLYGSHGAGWPLLMIVTGGKRDSVAEYQLPEKLNVISTVDDLKNYAVSVGGLVKERLDELREEVEHSQEKKENKVAPEGSAYDEGPREEPEEDSPGEPSNETSSPESSVAEEEEDVKELEIQEEEQGGWSEEENDSRQTHAIEAEDKVVVYQPRSRMKSLNKRVPANLATPIKEALDRVESAHGDIDAWVADELGWTFEQLSNRLAAEQVDAVALAMMQSENSKGLILGDYTGVGKGRVVATLYAWAIKQGKKPIFCTSKEGLFYDILRDFNDIGEAENVAPMILNSTKDIKDPETGEVLLKATPRKTVAEAVKKGTIPEGYNGVFMTYSQINKPLHKSPKADWLRKVSEGNALLFDEVHNAAGPDSNTGANISAAIRKSSFTLGASATYAKRPDNLGLYHFTSMFAGGDSETVISAINRGGPEYQEVLSTMLAASGQLIARSHRPAPAPEANVVNPQYEEGFDSREFADRLARVIDAMTAIADAGEEIVNEENKEIAEFIKGLPENAKGNYEGWKAQSLNFGSQAHHIVKVAMYAAKADAIVEEAEAEIKAGRRPVIALEGTMETFLREAHAKEFNARMEELLENHVEGEPMPSVGKIAMNITYRDTLMKFLDRMIVIKRTDRYGNETKDPMIKNLEKYKQANADDALAEAISEDLGKKILTQKDASMLGYYFAVQDAIEALPESLPASPLDYVMSKLKQKGIESVEMTGRDLGLNYDTDDGIPEFRHRSEQEKNRTAAANAFNNGNAQVILFNAAAAEGVSLNPSLKFKNQEPRTMLFWQVIGDVAAFNQQAGRIDRSGQDEKVMPRYRIVALDTPSEKRVLMNLINKTSSLNANKSADRDTGIGMNGQAMMNRVGDLVTFEVLSKHPNREAICKKLRIDLDDELNGFSESGMKTGVGTDTGIHSRVTGRLSRMQLAESEPLMEEMEEAYKDRIAWLDQQGTNPLRTTIHDFRGEIVNEHEIFPRSGPSEFEGDVRALELDYIDYINPIPFDKVEKQLSRSKELLEKGEFSDKPVNDLWPQIKQGMEQRIWENAVHHAKGFVASLEGGDQTQKLIEAIRKQPRQVSNNEDVIERLEALVRRMDTFKTLTEQLSLGGEIRGFPAMNALFDCEVESADVVVTRILPPSKTSDPCLGGKWSIRFASPDPDVGQFDLSLNQLMQHMQQTPTMRMSNDPLTIDEVHDRFSDDREPRSINCKRFALVGQLFTAYDITNNADSSLGRGKPGVFTTADGQKRRGIIMPRTFDIASVGRLLNSDFTISHQEVANAYIARICENSRTPVIYTAASYQNKRYSDTMKKPFTAGTGAIIKKDADTGTWKLVVSSVKRYGDAYHKDKVLADLLTTELATEGNMSRLMEATFEPHQLEAIVERLMSAHGQVFHGMKEDADWYREYMRERGKRLVQEQNERDQAAREKHAQQALQAERVEANEGLDHKTQDALELDF